MRLCFTDLPKFTVLSTKKNDQIYPLVGSLPTNLIPTQTYRFLCLHRRRKQFYKAVQHIHLVEQVTRPGCIGESGTSSLTWFT